MGESDGLLDEAPATADDTRREYLARAASGYAKVRHSLIQKPGPRGSSPALLPLFSRNHRALVLYLSLLANRPWLAREVEPLPAGAWVRFLTCADPKALSWTPQSLSHAWGVLENLGLITRPRKGRLKDVQPRREDGQAEYSYPEGIKTDPYLILPHNFWIDELHGTLSWPALAVLLILLKETGTSPTAQLAIDRAKGWYGISRTTAETGLTELRTKGLLASRDRMVRDVNTAEGRRRTSVHTLLGPYSMQAREALRSAARSRVVRSSQERGGEAEKNDEKTTAD